MAPFEGWFRRPEALIPPDGWARTLAIDVGGTSPWSWLWGAIDPDQNLVFYYEVYKPGTDIGWFVDQARPYMTTPGGGEYNWKFKCIDAAAKIAADDIRRKGI